MLMSITSGSWIAHCPVDLARNDLSCEAHHTLAFAEDVFRALQSEAVCFSRKAAEEFWALAANEVVALLVAPRSDDRDHRASRVCKRLVIRFYHDAFPGPFPHGAWVCPDNNQALANVHVESPNNRHELVVRLSRFRCKRSWRQLRPPHW